METNHPTTWRCSVTRALRLSGEEKRVQAAACARGRVAHRIKALALVLLGLAAAGNAGAQDDAPRRAVKPDPKRIINESMRFLQEREPDLTAEEHALYEKASQLIQTNPHVALTMLNGIVAESKSSQPASPAFDLLLGNLHYLSGSVVKAEASYLRAVNRYPTFLRAWTNLGLLYHAGGQHQKAVPCFAKAVSLGGRDSTTFGAMADCLERTGDAVGAEVAYIQALAVDPGNVLWMEGLLRVYLQAKQYARAEVMVRNLIQAQPREPRYWLSYAETMVATGRRLEGIALLEQALATGVAGERERIELAGLYVDEQLTEEAMRTFASVGDAAGALEPPKALQLARLLITRFEWDRARGLLNALEPKLTADLRREFLHARADLQVGTRQWADARRTLDELLTIDPMDGRALVCQGRVALADGDVSRATLSFEAALQTREGARAASVELATIELGNRHFQQSVTHLEKAVSLEKNAELEGILERVRRLLPNPSP